MHANPHIHSKTGAFLCVSTTSADVSLSAPEGKILNRGTSEESERLRLRFYLYTRQKT